MISLSVWLDGSTSLSDLCRRIVYRFMPASVRRVVVATLGRSWPFECPVCENRVSRFFPLPAFYLSKLRESGSDLRPIDFETCNSEAYECTHCGASDRDRLYALYVAERFTSAGSSGRELAVLDIAPSTALSRYITGHYDVRYRTADLLRDDVDDKVDVTAMTCYTDGSFDALICSHVLEHVTDDRQAMRELFRILKPGGWGIVMVPIHTSLDGVREHPVSTDADRWKYFGQNDHVRLYSRHGFVSRLQHVGFHVLELGREYFGTERMTRCGISPASVMYVAEKLGSDLGG